MCDYIERGAALDKCGWYNTVNGKSICAARKDELVAIPAADVVAVKHGEWVKHDCLTNDGTGNYTVKVGEIWVCSVCGRDEKYREPYCHCGAKMDGGGAE